MRTHSTILLLVVVAIVSSGATPAKREATAKVEKVSKVVKSEDTKSNAEEGKETPFFLSCPQGREWIPYKGKCYKYFEESKYWLTAEKMCKSVTGGKGHLVSINDKAENTFVSKLTYCRPAWTGGYAVSVDKLTQTDNYRWSDGSSRSFFAHDFSSIKHKHMPLLHLENMKWINNVYHAQQNFVCEVSAQLGNRTCDCPVGWRSLNGNCYFMPPFAATYIEGDYYCRGRDAHMVSVHDIHELRALSLLDLDSHECPVETWIGLVKLNPCRIDYATKQTICYQWSDRSAPFKNFPSWKPGHPGSSDRINCVFLKDTTIGTAECYKKHRFVCKKPVVSLNDVEDIQ